MRRSVFLGLLLLLLGVCVGSIWNHRYNRSEEPANLPAAPDRHVHVDSPAPQHAPIQVNIRPDGDPHSLKEETEANDDTAEEQVLPDADPQKLAPPLPPSPSPSLPLSPSPQLSALPASSTEDKQTSQSKPVTEQPAADVVMIHGIPVNKANLVSRDQVFLPKLTSIVKEHSGWLERPKTDQMVFVVGANSDHFSQLAHFLNNIWEFENQTYVIVLDMGFTVCELQDLYSRGRKELLQWRTVDFSQLPAHANLSIEAGQYAWKPYLIANLLTQVGFVLWIDSGSKLTQPISSMREKAAEVGFCGVIGGAGSVGSYVHEGMKQYYHIGKEFDQTELCAGGLVAFNIEVPFALELLSQWIDCASKLECIAPTGSARWNHRQDQAALSVLLIKDGHHPDYCSGSDSVRFHVFDRFVDPIKRPKC